MLHRLHTSLASYEVLFSLPQPSLAPSLFPNPSTVSPDVPSNCQNLIAYQAVEASQGTSDVPTTFRNPWKDGCVRQINRTKLKNQVRCEVCKVDFNSKTVFEDHISGKKHKKKMQLLNNPSNTILSGTSNVNVQVQDSSVQGQEPFVDAGHDLKSKKRKLLSMGEAEHDDQVDLTSKIDGIGLKKVKVTQPTRCEICMVNCNTKDIYIKHLSGKKHLRNLNKISKSEGDNAGAGADVSVANIAAAIAAENDKQCAPNPAAIESQEKPGTNEQERENSCQPNDVGTSIPSREFCTLSTVNNETVFNLLDWPARCEICMIDCNSKPVYMRHISGRRHKRNLKQASKSKNKGARASDADAVLVIMPAIDTQQATNQAIEPQERLEASPQEGVDALKSGGVVMLEAPEKHTATKKRKIEPFDGSATTFRVCKLCNAPCNSEAAFNSHLHGKKHAAMVKKLANSQK